MIKRTMRKIMVGEFRKLRNYPRWTLFQIVNPDEINNIRVKLRESRVKYKTISIIRGNTIMGYKIYVM